MVSSSSVIFAVRSKSKIEKISAIFSSSRLGSTASKLASATMPESSERALMLRAGEA